MSKKKIISIIIDRIRPKVTGMYKHQSGTYTVRNNFFPFDLAFLSKSFEDVKAKYIYEKDEYRFDYKDGKENQLSILKRTANGWEAIDDVTDQEFAKELGRAFDAANN